MVLSYDKELVKENIELEDMYNILEFLEAEPQMYGNYIVAKTICHDGDTHKLYWYENTRLFKCYSGSCGSFDIFELVQKHQGIDDLNKAIYFVVNFFNLQGRVAESDDDYSSEDWKLFSRYNKIDDISPEEKGKVVLPEFDLSLFKHYPRPQFMNWEKEGIVKEVCDYMDIAYDPVNGGIIIPHKDENGRCVGVRYRTLVQEQEQYGKYRPMKAFGQMFNHPLAFNLYGLDKAKDNIKNMKTAIVVESEKAVLQYISYFGTSSNICVAVCGSSLSKYQFQLLLDQGVKEIVIAFDRDFEEIGSKDYYQVIDKLQKLYDKYSPFVNISFLFDKECNQLGYKDSPLDCGKEKFLYLFRNRVVL